MEKLCLITGANSGVGLATAMALAKNGARVVLACRDTQRGQAALETIRANTGSRKLELMLLDLGRLQSIRDFAAEFKKKHNRLDVLVNNAGAMLAKRTTTHDGFETTFGVNHLGPFLLTNLLLEVLKASHPARIVNVASGAHSFGWMDFGDLQGERFYLGFKAYSQSKLANIIFTCELAERLKGSGVTANCLHPGMVDSNFANPKAGSFHWLGKLIRPLMVTIEQGADTAVYLATSPDVEGVSGKYFYKRKAVKSSRKSRSKSAANKLWAISEKLTGLKEKN
ncbi:MAG: SDR family oxidoreductase [Deltaproteobacteria bacterium]|nr:SDR family oxidoreductase [Deltaproteobacteria bacterium]